MQCSMRIKAAPAGQFLSLKASFHGALLRNNIKHRVGITLQQLYTRVEGMM